MQGKEYQQGILAGYETREYLLEKWLKQCAYCGVKDVPLQVEHIHPRAKGGTNSITNLTLSCAQCNLKKGTVKAIATKGKKVGKYLGRIATRSSGNFNISTAKGLIQGISHKYCKHIHKKDGYGYIA